MQKPKPKSLHCSHCFHYVKAVRAFHLLRKEQARSKQGASKEQARSKQGASAFFMKQVGISVPKKSTLSAKLQ